jgi:hypothetical protein
MSIQPIQSTQPSMLNEANEKNKTENLFNLKKRPLDQIDTPNKKRKISKGAIEKEEFKTIENDTNIKIILNFLRNTDSSKTGKEFDIVNIKKVEKFDTKDCKLTVVNYTDIPVTFDKNRKLFIESQHISTYTPDDCQIIVYKKIEDAGSIYIAEKDEANPNISLNNISGYSKSFNHWIKHLPEDFDLAGLVMRNRKAMNEMCNNPYMS